MLVPDKNIIKKTSKIKRFSRYNLYKKISPGRLYNKIPNDLLTENGYTKDELFRDIYRLIDCNNNISFIDRKSKKLNEIIEESRIFDTNHCNIFTLCPVCAEKISKRRREKYREPLLEISDKYKYAYMVTFTVRDEKRFLKAYENLTSAIRKYVLMGQLRGTNYNGQKVRSKGEASKIKAMVVSKEIKIGKNSKYFHVHGHAIIFTNKKMDYSVYDKEERTRITRDIRGKYKRPPTKEELSKAIKHHTSIELINQETGEIYYQKIAVSKASKEWVKATGGLSCNIRFDPLFNTNSKGDLVKSTPKQIFNQCIEIIKYTSKVSDFNTEQIIEILSERKGKRYFTTYGELYNVKSEKEEETEELENNNLRGYIWSNKENSLIKIEGAEKEHLYMKFEKKEQYYKAKSVMMKAWYIKEDIKKKEMKTYNNIVSLQNKELKKVNNEIERKAYSESRKVIKNACIESINHLENCYILFKKVTFKKYMGIKLNGRDRIKTALLPAAVKFRTLSMELFKTN